MLRIYRSHSLENLAQLLGHGLRTIAQKKLDLESAWIVVPNGLTGDWLKFRLADVLGVCVGSNFQLPGQFAWTTLQNAYSTLPERSLAEPSILVFLINAWLADQQEIAKFAILQRYLRHLDTRARWQLASRLAHIFDQYLLYRPDWIQSWTKGCLLNLGGDEVWQAYLWRRIQNNLQHGKEGGGAIAESRPNLNLNPNPSGVHWSDWIDTWCKSWPTRSGELHQRQGGAESIGGRYTTVDSEPKPLAPVFFFAVSSLSPPYLKFLQTYSQQAEVACLVWDPSREYWGDEEAGFGLSPIPVDEVGADCSLNSTEDQAKNSVIRQLVATDANYSPAILQLLNAQGRSGRLFLEQLNELADEVVGIYPEDTHLVAPNTLLQALQRQMLTLRDEHSAVKLRANEGAEQGMELLFSDRSVTIHSTAGLMRELEALYDSIWQNLQTHPTWQCSDVLVLLPDYEVYLPYIHAVFGSRSAISRFPGEIGSELAPGNALSYTLAETPSILGRVWLDWFRLVESRWPVEMLLDWFALPAVAARFGLFPFADTDEFDARNSNNTAASVSLEFGEQLSYLRRLVKAADIRWGKDGAHKATMDLPPEDRYTLQWGLSRLWLGYAFPLEGVQEPYLDMLPVEGVTEDMVPVLLAWDRYLETLQYFVRELQKPKPVHDWANLLRWGLEQLLAPTSQSDQTMVQNIAQQIELWEQCAKGAEETVHGGLVSGTIDWRSVLAWLEEAQQTSIRMDFWRGGILFAPLTVGAGLPFKMVAILGLNDGEFPGVDYPPSFNLLNRHPRLGDRTRKSASCWEFLQACGGAQEVLYLSYHGRHPVDGTIKPPAGVLVEWMEVIKRQYGQAQLDHCCMQHPLQLFSDADWKAMQHKNGKQNLPIGEINSVTSPATDRYQKLKTVGGVERVDRPRLSPLFFTSHEAWKTAALADVVQGMGLNVLDISLDDLVRFVRNPARWFTRQVLRCYLPQASELNEDIEPLVGTNLLAARLRHQAMRTYLGAGDASPEKGAKLARSMDYAQAAGWIPSGEHGKIWARGVVQQTERLQNKLQELATDNLPPLHITIERPCVRLTGNLRHLYPSGLHRWVSRKLSDADYLGLWLEHLVWQQYCEGTTNMPEYYRYIPPISRLLGLEQEVVLEEVPNAQEHLERVIYWYCVGLMMPVPLLRDASREWALWRVRNPHIPTEDQAIALNRQAKSWRKLWRADLSYRRQGDRGNAFLHPVRDIYETWIWRDMECLQPQGLDLFSQVAEEIWIPLLTAIQISDY